MKVCTGTTRSRSLTYSDLDPGDIFSWGSDDNDFCALKTEEGHVWLTDGDSHIKDIDDSNLVTSYPDACVTLGNPKQTT